MEIFKTSIIASFVLFSSAVEISHEDQKHGLENAFNSDSNLLIAGGTRTKPRITESSTLDLDLSNLLGLS